MQHQHLMHTYFMLFLFAIRIVISAGGLQGSVRFLKIKPLYVYAVRASLRLRPLWSEGIVQSNMTWPHQFTPSCGSQRSDTCYVCDNLIAEVCQYDRNIILTKMECTSFFFFTSSLIFFQYLQLLCLPQLFCVI